MVKRLMVSLTLSGTSAVLCFFHDAGIATITSVFVTCFVAFFLFTVMVRPRVIVFAALILIVSCGLLELALAVIDTNDLFNLQNRKEWFHREKPYDCVLVCYPSNPQGYFLIDLRNADEWAKYEVESADWLRTPYCIEEKFNALGYRDGEIPSHKERPRAIFLGDSFVLGEGVRVEDRFTDVLKKKYWSRDYEVYNFGSTGAGTQEVYAKSFKEALLHAPDAILYCFVLNDPIVTGELSQRQKFINDLMNIRYYNSDLCKFFKNKLSARHASPYVTWLFRIEKEVVFKSKLFFALRSIIVDRLITRETIRWYRDMYTPRNSGWELTKDLIMKMNSESKNEGIFFAVVILPLFYNFAEYPFVKTHEIIREFCAESRIACLDTLSAFSGEDHRKCIVYPIDYHPSRYAHDIIAHNIYDFMQGQNW